MNNEILFALIGFVLLASVTIGFRMFFDDNPYIKLKTKV